MFERATTHCRTSSASSSRGFVCGILFVFRDTRGGITHTPLYRTVHANSSCNPAHMCDAAISIHRHPVLDICGMCVNTCIHMAVVSVRSHDSPATKNGVPVPGPAKLTAQSPSRTRSEHPLHRITTSPAVADKAMCTIPRTQVHTPRHETKHVLTVRRTPPGPCPSLSEVGGGEGGGGEHVIVSDVWVLLP